MFQDDDPRPNDHEEFDSPLDESRGSHEIEDPSQCPERALWFFPRYDDCSSPCSFLDNQDGVIVDVYEFSISSCYEEDMLELAIHRKIMSLVLEFSICSLQERLHELNSYLPSSSITLDVGSSNVPAPHPYHSSSKSCNEKSNIWVPCLMMVHKEKCFVLI